MRVSCDTLADAKQAAWSARDLCRAARREMGHALDCDCPICAAEGFLSEAVKELGVVDAKDANRVW